MIERLQQRRTENQVRRNAERAAGRILRAAEEKGAIRSVEDVIRTVEEEIGLPVAVCQMELPEGQVGFTELSDGCAVIVVAPLCATRQHTLAHELGHLVLGHRHGGVELAPPPPGGEALWEALHRELERETALNEMVAEMFAVKLLKMLPRPGEDKGMVQWKEALG